MLVIWGPGHCHKTLELKVAAPIAGFGRLTEADEVGTCACSLPSA
jgi:hypothetical protein